jgi:3-oxoacyl-[acyl-carrier protein] reductase
MCGRRVVITGATRGLGAALAKHHLDAGDYVVGCGRTEPSVTHERYTHCCLDVTEPADVEQFFEEFRERYETLDVLINNAGVASMMRSSKAARIVNITSVAVPLRLQGEAIYAASKAALETFTRIAARELGPFGITCNAVGPSPVRTGLVAGVSSKKMDALIQSQAVRRWAEPSDVVNVVDFFLRPESSMITGQVIYLGGAG